MTTTTRLLYVFLIAISTMPVSARAEDKTRVRLEGAGVTDTEGRDGARVALQFDERQAPDFLGTGSLIRLKAWAGLEDKEFVGGVIGGGNEIGSPGYEVNIERSLVSLRGGGLFNFSYTPDLRDDDTFLKLRLRLAEFIRDRKSGAGGYNPTVGADIEHQLTNSARLVLAVEAGPLLFMRQMRGIQSTESGVGVYANAHAGVEIKLGEEGYLRPEMSFEGMTFPVRNTETGEELNPSSATFRVGFAAGGAL